MAASSFLLVLLAELIALVVARHWALPIAGLAVAVMAIELRNNMAGAKPEPPETPPVNEALESLYRWKSQTDAMIRWSDSGRTEWDRHLRPKLAREFLLATRQKEPAAVAATGRMVFGDDLWPWVDPHNTQPAKRDEPGPGRATLDEILRRLEQA
ncbi:MAG: hypothetical protein KDB71_20360 [Mycobacterium sp.]|nr:hypothetical protein [Mycobacterium sp.]